MNIYIKNNNIYYEDYKINDGRLSLFLVPIALLIIYNKKLIKYFSYIFLCIGFIGLIDTYLEHLKYKNAYLIFILIALLHSLLLFPLTNIKKYMKPNIINFLLGLIGILIIIFLPYWPYELSRKLMIYIIIIVYTMSLILYEIKK